MLFFEVFVYKIEDKSKFVSIRFSIIPHVVIGQNPKKFRKECDYNYLMLNK